MTMVNNLSSPKSRGSDGGKLDIGEDMLATPKRILNHKERASVTFSSAAPRIDSPARGQGPWGVAVREGDGVANLLIEIHASRWTTFFPNGHDLLKFLNLGGGLLNPEITDAGLKELTAFKNLKVLIFCSSKVTNTGL
jgi:hypothetical protein